MCIVTKSRNHFNSYTMQHHVMKKVCMQVDEECSNHSDIESEESPVCMQVVAVEKVQTAVIQTVKKKELIVKMYTMGIKTKIWVSMQMLNGRLL